MSSHGNDCKTWTGTNIGCWTSARWAQLGKYLWWQRSSGIMKSDLQHDPVYCHNGGMQVTQVSWIVEDQL